ncbi:arginine and glutamate-rich protein 1-B-like [Onthophagus taurus]|uniref:arginine and glutamate-rich protein 1-B-like n=1 Tax=Onthophagus taurus TaxID=166361 RepID=UPI0039BE1450
MAERQIKTRASSTGRKDDTDETNQTSSKANTSSGDKKETAEKSQINMNDIMEMMRKINEDNKIRDENNRVINEGNLRKLNEEITTKIIDENKRMRDENKKLNEENRTLIVENFEIIMKNNLEKLEQQLNNQIEGITKALDGKITYQINEKVETIRQKNTIQIITTIDQQINEYSDKIKENKDNIINLKEETHQNLNSLQEEQDKLKKDIIINQDLNKQNFDNLKTKECENYDNVIKIIENIKKTRSNMINLDSTSTLLYLKSEMWPKFRGIKDKIHPMTYLHNLIRLTTDIDDPKLILNLIQLTLEEQALEWYEMVANKCHN